MSDVKRAAEKAKAAREAIGTVVHGYGDVVDLLLVALTTGGHTLLEGVPGVGKTTLAKTFARTSGLAFTRVQLTPDLMPADITGHDYYDQGKSAFEVRKGPVFTNVLLADEINRAPARTQSALLEVMEEGQVTIEGTTMPVPDPFLVVATKNPVDIEGVYPLPEAQLDRFMLFIRMDYPDAGVEERMLLGKLKRGGDVPVLKELVPTLRDALPQVTVHADVVRYVLALTRATRDAEGVELGAGPRASEHLLAASRAAALLAGRNYVIPDDVKRLAVPVLAHRIILTADAEVAGLAKADVITRVLDATPVPVEAATAHGAN